MRAHILSVLGQIISSIDEIAFDLKMKGINYSLPELQKELFKMGQDGLVIWHTHSPAKNQFIFYYSK